MACQTPTLVTGTTYADFQSSLAALVPTCGGGWTKGSPLVYVNGQYQQLWFQAFPVDLYPLMYRPPLSYLRGMLKPQRGWR